MTLITTAQEEKYENMKKIMRMNYLKRSKD